jgi:CRP-like cAMP-binding protein
MAVRNRLLAVVLERDSTRIAKRLELVLLASRQILTEANQPIEHVFFPQSGIVSIIAQTGEGDRMDIGMIGWEGLVGLPIVHEVDRSPHCCCVQVAGEAMRMTAADLQRAMQERPDLRRVLLHYAQAVLFQAAQIAICNARHRLEGRLALWLLQAGDRLDNNKVPLTHETLGLLLGVRRAGVTAALNALESAGAIYHGRSRVIIHDRVKLEAATCSCYGLIKAEFDRLLRAPAAA